MEMEEEKDDRLKEWGERERSRKRPWRKGSGCGVVGVKSRGSALDLEGWRVIQPLHL